jgi:hypothetical protein
MTEDDWTGPHTRCLGLRLAGDAIDEVDGRIKQAPLRGGENYPLQARSLALLRLRRSRALARPAA